MTPTDKTVAEDLNPDDFAFCQWSERRFAFARSVERWDVSISGQYAYLAGWPAPPGLTPAAKARLARIAPLNRLAVAVLEEQFHPGRLSPSQATGELNEVGRAYGLRSTETADDSRGTAKQVISPEVTRCILEEKGRPDRKRLTEPSLG